jgi:hypothetical protein
VLISDQRDRADSAEPTERSEPAEMADRVEPTEAADRHEPTDPTDRAEPTAPMLSTDPADPIDRTDPVLAIDRNESSDHNERSPMGDIVAPHPARPHRASQDFGPSGLPSRRQAGKANGRGSESPARVGERLRSTLAMSRRVIEVQLLVRKLP